jgi:hypothetical protein
VKIGPAPGPLAFEQFQAGYATNDVERACAVFAERYGIREFRRLEGEMQGGGHIRIEIAWAGGMLYELIQADGPGGEFYRARLPADRFAIRHHHHGFLVTNAADWEALNRQIDQGGWKVALTTDVPGFMKAVYIDAPELEHHLEYLFPEAAGYEFFETAPSF